MNRLHPRLFIIFLIFSLSCKVSETGNQPEVKGEPVEEENLLVADEELQYRASRLRLHDLIHTKLEINFDWQKQYVNGIATLALKPYFYPQRRLILDAKGFDIHSIALLQKDQKLPLQYEYDGLQLDIDLSKEFTKTDTYSLEIKYTAKPNERKISGSIAITSDKGLYFIDPLGDDPDKPQQIWTQGETEANSAWFPTIDSPNERCTQEMYITVENRFKTLSNGQLVSSEMNENGTRTDYWKMEKPHAPYLFMVAVGEFAVVEDNLDELPINYYVDPKFEKYARDIFGNTPEMISFFERKLNYKYPWPKYHQVVVEDFVSGAMENTTASVFMEALHSDTRELLDKNWDDIIAHELFHQWFGDLVTTESWSNLVLNEGFANYSEYLWAEYKYGVDQADYQGLEELNNYLSESKHKQVDLVRFFYESREDMFDSHSYAKGGRILHMLRKHIGDDAFYKTLEYYLKQHEFSSVEVHDLRLAFEKITGQDLNWFFNQWFLASGHPQLKISHQYINNKVLVKVQQLQDERTTPIYTLPLYIDVWVNNVKKRHSVIVEKETEVFEFPTTTKPDLVLFDGEQQLLAEIDHEKTKEELIFQYYNSDKFLARHEAVTKLTDSLQYEPVKIMLTDALGDKFWGIRQVAVNAFENVKGDNSGDIEKKLEFLATSDEKSLVRADAISVLSSLNVDKYSDLYQKGMQDSSYSVVGASIFSYAQSNSPNKDEVLNQFENYKNSNVWIPLASFYAASGNIDKFEWFEQKLKKEKESDLYYSIQLFAELLEKAPMDYKKRGTVLLEELATNDKQVYIRLAAYQALDFMSDLPEMEEVKKRIKANEKDQRLQQLYKQLP